MEAFAHLQDRFIGFEPDVGNVGVDHQREQVQDEIGGFAQSGVCCEAVLLEGGVVRGRSAAHAFDHFFAEFHHGRKRLRVAPEDVAKVGVKEMTLGG